MKTKEDVKEFINNHQGKSYSYYFVSVYALKKREIDLENIKQGNIQPMKVDRKKYPKSYTVLDIETTGFSKENDQILQISALRVRDNKIVDTFNTYVYTKEINFSKSAFEVNGITYKDVENAPKMDEALTNFFNFLDFEGKFNNEVFLGYNVKFDLEFINEKSPRKLSNKYFDVLKLAQRKIPYHPTKLPDYKLITVSKFYNFNFNWHNGLEDCKACFEVYQKLKNE
ncbi:MAG: polymerase epsilon subunit [Haloplasmataceae bacterium]|nr:polymerase epsilon subunit [Haloplasmataceae bacterium]